MGAAVPAAPFSGNDDRVGLAVDSNDPARKGLLAWVYEYSYLGWIYPYTYCRTVAADGTLGSTFYLGGGDQVRSPAVAFSSGSGRYAVAFKSGTYIYVTVRSQTGAQVSAPVVATTSGDLPQVVWRETGDEFIVLYTQTMSSSNYRVYARRVSSSGVLIGKGPTQLASLRYTNVVPQSLAAAYRPTGDQLLVGTSWSDSYYWNFTQAYYQHRSGNLISNLGGFYAYAVENELSLAYNPTADTFWKTSRPTTPASQIAVTEITPGATWFGTTLTAATIGTVTEPSVAFTDGLSEGVVTYPAPRAARRTTFCGTCPRAWAGSVARCRSRRPPARRCPTPSSPRAGRRSGTSSRS